MSTCVSYSDEVREQLVELWLVYGNHGPRHTFADHRYIQCLIERRTDYRAFFHPTAACLAAIEQLDITYHRPPRS